MLKLSVLLLVGTWLSFPGDFLHQKFTQLPGGGGALGYFLGGYVPPGNPNWHPVLKKNSPKIDTPFYKWANFLYPILEFALKLIPRSRNGPIFYTPF